MSLAGAWLLPALVLQECRPCCKQGKLKTAPLGQLLNVPDSCRSLTVAIGCQPLISGLWSSVLGASPGHLLAREACRKAAHRSDIKGVLTVPSVASPARPGRRGPVAPSFIPGEEARLLAPLAPLRMDRRSPARLKKILGLRWECLKGKRSCCVGRPWTWPELAGPVTVIWVLSTARCAPDVCLLARSGCTYRIYRSW